MPWGVSQNAAQTGMQCVFLWSVPNTGITHTHTHTHTHTQTFNCVKYICLWFKLFTSYSGHSRQVDIWFVTEKVNLFVCVSFLCLLHIISKDGGSKQGERIDQNLEYELTKMGTSWQKWVGCDRTMRMNWPNEYELTKSMSTNRSKWERIDLSRNWLNNELTGT